MTIVEVRYKHVFVLRLVVRIVTTCVMPSEIHQLMTPVFGLLTIRVPQYVC